jgi:hypothetical protein
MTVNAKQITLRQAAEHIKLARAVDKMGMRDWALDLLEEARLLIALADVEVA